MGQHLSPAALAVLLVAGGVTESKNPVGPYATCSPGWAATDCEAGFTLYDVQGQEAGYGTPHFGGSFLIYDARGSYQGYAKRTSPGGLDLYDAHRHWRGAIRFR
jgi:hypothetical protein